ncbi:MAG: T9SS type A sorting domain-containing protein [Chitinophagaceae bacterium]|nr:T9SS type A sorting domain-containing protein [Chitinophagaceae bacterium]MCZ2396783.1 T9SS type A sorting domain-containing protein [Chitinophagales bacterium]
MRLIFTLMVLLLVGSVDAQRCGTELYMQNLPPTTRSFIQRGAPLPGRDTLKGEVIVVPVVVHVLYNTSAQNISDQRIQAQLDALNRDFRRRNADTVNTPVPFKSRAADVQIVFSLAKKDPNGNPTSGIVRKYTKEKVFLADDGMKFSSSGGADAWDASRYLNIWVCNLFGRTLGYTPMPGADPGVDGIVIQYGVFGYKGGLGAPYNLGRTLTHEAGHWLGLKHVWGDEECGDDGIFDTPRQQGPNTGHNVFPKMSACSEDGNGDMFMNYMDFSDDADLNMFTLGQKTEMRSLFAKGGYRNSIINSDVMGNSEVGEEGPQEKNWDNLFRYYPNPTQDFLIVEGRSFNEINGSYLKLYDLQGKLLVNQRIQAEKTKINMSGLAAGVYVLSVEGIDKRRVYKVVKSGQVSGQ